MARNAWRVRSSPGLDVGSVIICYVAQVANLLYRQLAARQDAKDGMAIRRLTTGDTADCQSALPWRRQIPRRVAKQFMASCVAQVANLLCRRLAAGGAWDSIALRGLTTGDGPPRPATSQFPHKGYSLLRIVVSRLPGRRRR